MRRSRKKQLEESGRSLSDRELRRYVIFLVIPFLALLLIIAAMIFGRYRASSETKAANQREEGQAKAAQEPMPVIEPDTKQYFQDFGGSILEQDVVPEIKQLMEQYFLSISQCDMETFLNLFTSRDTSEEEVFRSKFEQQKQYIENYQNISCYTVKGLENDTYAVYVYYEVKFKDVNTLGPALVRVYAIKCDDGQYRIFDEEASPELEEYFNQLSANEDVRLLINQVDRQADEAMELDVELKKRISYLKNGPDYMNEEEALKAEETPEEQ